MRLITPDDVIRAGACPEGVRDALLFLDWGQTAVSAEEAIDLARQVEQDTGDPSDEHVRRAAGLAGRAITDDNVGSGYGRGDLYGDGRGLSISYGEGYGYDCGDGFGYGHDYGYGYGYDRDYADGDGGSYGLGVTGWAAWREAAPCV